jgi:glycosyltransferase involved in cell wall biosynthesis
MSKLLYIGNKLAAKGNTPTAIDVLGSMLQQEGFKVFYASSKKNKFLRLIDMIFTTLKTIHKVDFVLIDTYSTFNFWYALLVSQICRLFNKKYIPILHGGNLSNRLENNPILSKMLFSNAYKLVSPSQFLVDVFTKAGYTNIKLIPNSINLNEFKFKEKEWIEPKLFWIRSFATIYNPIMAVKVLKELNKTYPNASLCMVGPAKDNSYEATKKYAEKHQLNVHFTGKLSKFEWIELSKNYNVFINTTNFDNMPFSVIEAMALGFPVVSTNVGGISYLLQHNKNGLLVDANDVEQMTAEIKRIFSIKMLPHQLTQQAKLNINNFDWNFVKNEWKNLLKLSV